MKKKSKIFITDSETFIGSALLSELIRRGHTNVIRQADGLIDLTSQSSVSTSFSKFNPEYVFVVASKSGGILANQKYPADLMINNLQMICNVIQNVFHHKAKKPLYLVNLCTYPRNSPQPMKEEYLLTGSLEPTNEAYAVSKLSGIKLWKAYKQQYGAHFIVEIPTNAFGPLRRRRSSQVPRSCILGLFHQPTLCRNDGPQVWTANSTRSQGNGGA